jgi:hypothetical protein
MLQNQVIFSEVEDDGRLQPAATAVSLDRERSNPSAPPGEASSSSFFASQRGPPRASERKDALPNRLMTHRSSRKRHRKLLPLSIFLRPLGVHPQRKKETSSSSQDPFWRDIERPDTAQLTQLVAVLLLTTVLGVLAALDAKYECLKHETYAVMDLTDDDGGNAGDENYNYDTETYQAAFDEARMIEADGCLRMFRRVCLPVLAATLLMGFLGLWILRQSQSTPALAVRWMSRLVVVLVALLVAQTYHVTLIMLRPRLQDDSENPFHSLGAVDVTGQIGGNANLYYLVWLSQILSISLVYLTVGALIRARRAAAQAALAQGLLPSTSWWILDEDYHRENHRSRHTWYKSIYKLRVRTGIWTAALITCLVLTASAQYVWRQFMWPYVLLSSDNNVAKYDGQQHSWSESTNMDFSFCQTMAANSEGLISATLCRRTVMAWFSGALSFLLSAFSIGMHLVARARAHGLVANEHRQQLYYMQRINIFRKLLNRHQVPLVIELILSLVLSLLLGFNAVLTTGVQGPATTVGNLYYASWGSFLLVVRIGLGCLEEWYEVEKNKEDKAIEDKESTTDPLEAASSTEEKATGVALSVDVDGSLTSFETDSSDLSGSTSSVMMDALEKDRVDRLRSYFFLCIFSTCCAAAAFDAAVNQEEGLTKIQRFLILAPCLVALQSLVLFCLCFSKKCYLVVSHVCIGGLLSLLSFGLWLGTLVLTMHSDHSWAVNGIGEIRLANLYYFTWASILTAGTWNACEYFSGQLVNDF